MANSNKNKIERPSGLPEFTSWPEPHVIRELKHDHIWGLETCFVHGCPDCCGCADVPWLCASCYEVGFFGWKERPLEAAMKRYAEYTGLTEQKGVEDSLKGKELLELEGEKDWLEVGTKEGDQEWVEVEKNVGK